MSCKNPNIEIFAEISKTLETLGPKFQNARNFDMKLVGGVLKEDVHSYSKNIPNVQVLRDGTEKERGPSEFLETLGGSYDSTKRGRFALKFCAMGSLGPML
jgi:hypothetical protein